MPATVLKNKNDIIFMRYLTTRIILLNRLILTHPLLIYSY
jgi:hypothetical protein